MNEKGMIVLNNRLNQSGIRKKNSSYRLIFIWIKEWLWICLKLNKGIRIEI